MKNKYIVGKDLNKIINEIQPIKKSPLKSRIGHKGGHHVNVICATIIIENNTKPELPFRDDLENFRASFDKDILLGFEIETIQKNKTDMTVSVILLLSEGALNPLLINITEYCPDKIIGMNIYSAKALKPDKSY